jgi:hypothetical protein
MKRLPKLFLAAFVLLVGISCEDILEEDISNDTVQIIFPQNNVTVSSNVVSFQWSELDGADKYRIQVFNSTSGIVVDSLVTQTNFSSPIQAGSYQWRVRGENSAYQSNYTFNINFSVIQTSDLTNQQVILSSPSNNLYTNASSLVLDWQDLANAATYSFELLNVTGGNLIVTQQSGLTNSSVTLAAGNLQQEAEYLWRVKAMNSSTNTVFSDRVFYIDRTLPNTPQLTTPTNNSSTAANQTVSFSWTMASDSGTIQSPISYVIEFSNSSSFSSVIQSTDVNTTSFQQTFTVSGDYYWRVRAKDVAGNIGSNSNVFKFIVN